MWKWEIYRVVIIGEFGSSGNEKHRKSFCGLSHCVFHWSASTDSALSSKSAILLRAQLIWDRIQPAVLAQRKLLCWGKREERVVENSVGGGEYEIRKHPTKLMYHVSDSTLCDFHLFRNSADPYIEEYLYHRSAPEENTFRRLSQIKKKKPPWSESASELYRPSDRRLSAKWLWTFTDRGCHVVGVADPYGRILGFLDRSRYFSIK
jgi:hypothetical protein